MENTFIWLDLIDIQLEFGKGFYLKQLLIIIIIFQEKRLDKSDFYLEERFNLIAEAIDKSGEENLLFLSKLVFSLSNELNDNQKLKTLINDSLMDL